MKICVVTTCSAEGFKAYGRRMVDSFARHWPADIRLIHYVEGFSYVPPVANIELRELPQWFGDWKRRHAVNADAHGREAGKNRNGRAYDYRRDCVRFAHKIAALTGAGNEACDLLIWMDADTFAHETVTSDWIKSLFPQPAYMAWLDRDHAYPECGFMMFRPWRTRHRDFMKLLRDIYESDAVFGLLETHDSFVIQHVVKQCIREGWFCQPCSLSGPQGRLVSHPFVVSRLGERLDHVKGARKKLGRTESREAPGRDEAHWR